MSRLLLLVPLAACVAAPPAATELRSLQTAACAATIAAHIGQPVAAVTARWLSEASGVARVEARDGGRTHICEVDAAGRVLGYVHPGA